MTDNRRQVAGFLLSPDWIHNPALSEPYIGEMARHGYGTAILFVRHMHMNVLDPAVHDAVKAMTAIAHGHDLKFVLDTDHKWWGGRFVEEHPEAVMWAIGSYAAAACDGRFEVRADYPRVEGICILEKVVAVFRPWQDGWTRVPDDGVDCEWQNYGHPRGGVLIRGTVKDGASGPLAVYVAFRAYEYPDLAHPAYLHAQKALLDRYSDVPLEGVGWDEPGKGLGEMRYFKAGPAFLDGFRERKGYDLTAHLIYLDHMDGTAKAARIRCDYYQALVDMNYRAQDEHNRHACRLFGDHILLGTHQTWSGLPTDLVAGCIDYFRLGRLLTAAWTDGSWSCELRYQALHYLLADGVRVETGLRDAYYNDWTKQVPAVEDMLFANRYKKLFRVNWFNIFFSHFTENEVNFRLEPLRTRSIEDVAALDEFDALLGDGSLPMTDVAWLYLWEGMAAAPKWMTRAAYTAFSNMALHLVDRGLFATMMGTDSILKAEIGPERFSVGPRSYRAVLVPYAHALPGPVYDRLLKMADAGIAVVFVGPPPEFAADTERCLAADFAERVGMAPLTLREYEAAYAAKNGLPALNEWEPDWIDFSYPVRVGNGRPVRDSEGELLYVRAPDRPLYYMPLADPREDLANLLETLAPPRVDVLAERTYVRGFADPDRAGRLVILAAAKGRIADAPLTPDRYANHARPPRKRGNIKARIRTEGHELCLRGGAWCAVLVEDGKAVRAIGDAPTVLWDGQPVAR